MKFCFIVFIILILSLSLVFAEEFNLEKPKILEYKSIRFELLSVGSSESIILKVNDVERLIGHEKEETIYDIKIRNLDADYVSQTARVSLESTAECIIDEDCRESDPCRNSVCNYRKCEFIDVKPGCVFENECRPISSFEEISKVLSYCSESNSWEPRKTYKLECTYNYECLSNLCKGTCSGTLFGGEKMAPAWILIVIGGLLITEALFLLLLPKQSKDFIRDLSFLSSKKLRIIALIELGIALTLIIWSLT